MFAEILVGALGQIIGEVFSDALEPLVDRSWNRRALDRALASAVARAEERFGREYRAHDAELADVLTAQTRFADLPSVRLALRDLLTHPFHDPLQPIAVLQRSFGEVLPNRMDRTRVDAAVAAFLHCLGQEVLYIPQLQHLYALAFQKASAEQGRAIAANTAALVESMRALHDDLVGPAARPQLAAQSISLLPQPVPRARPWHNLPQRSYTRFVGRQEELNRLNQLLLPHPRSRHYLVTLDGIGGVGKSALAIELASRYRDGYADLPSAERFEAIVWVSAKRTLLTASGIQQRQQTFNTLSDLYREIATVLELPAITQSSPEQRRGLVERALSSQRTLLIVDNLETVDDEELLTFLRELPDPTKAIITTRHRIDIAYTIRLSGMPRDEALALMTVEAARKNVEISESHSQLDELYRRTGGIPLAIVWSIALMSLGYGVESVLRRLGSGHSDIARFCFAESVARIQGRDAYRLLLALALFESHVGRQMLGLVAGLENDEIGRDDGLAELLQLSLINQKGTDFFLLPLTQSFVLDELARQPELERELRTRWVDHLTGLAQPYADLRWRQPDNRLVRKVGPHFVTLAAYAQRLEQPDVLLRVFPGLAAYYVMIGEWDEARSIAEVALEYARLTGQLQSIVFIESHILAWMLRQQGQQDEAERYIEDALHVAQQLFDPLWQSDTLVYASQVLRHRPAPAEAQQVCQQALALVPLLSEQQQIYVRADVENELGRLASDQGDWLAARTHFMAAREVFANDDDDPPFNVEYAWSLVGSLGLVLHHLGTLDEAARMYEQSLDFFRELGNKGYVTTLLARLAELEEQRANNTAALEYAHEALRWSQRLGMVREQQQARQVLARLEH